MAERRVCLWTIQIKVNFISPGEKICVLKVKICFLQFMKQTNEQIKLKQEICKLFREQLIYQRSVGHIKCIYLSHIIMEIVSKV